MWLQWGAPAEARTAGSACLTARLSLTCLPALTQVPHDAGCPMCGATLRDALLPFVPNAPLPNVGAMHGSKHKTALIERFTDSQWALAGLGSTGWVWGASLGGRQIEGMPSFGTGDVVRVTLDLSQRGKLSFSVNGGEPVVAVKQALRPPPTSLTSILATTTLTSLFPQPPSLPYHSCTREGRRSQSTSTRSCT
jgi:hypothetical protein